MNQHFINLLKVLLDHVDDKDEFKYAIYCLVNMVKDCK